MNIYNRNQLKISVDCYLRIASYNVQILEYFYKNPVVLTMKAEQIWTG